MSGKHRQLTGAVMALIMLLTACSSHNNATTEAHTGTQPSSTHNTHGPMFPECGGISDEVLAGLTQVTGLVVTAKNSVGCQWLARGDLMGPHFSFSWYRGSPIGRERKTEQVSRNSVEDVTVNGHHGFIAMGSEPTLGNNLCEVGIQFGSDFIEWSINFVQKPFPDPCDIAKQLTRTSIENAR